jgi:hypothetical protein
MKKLPRSLIGVIATAAAFAALGEAGGETWPLELKRLEPLDRAQADSGEISDFLYRDTNFLSFYMRTQSRGQAISAAIPPPDFSTIKKQPRYESEHPLRGAVKLGSYQYAFALDVKRPGSGPRPSETDRDAPESGPEAEKAEQEKPKSVPYNRLYFDLNHNGDLTDDGVIEAVQPVRVDFAPNDVRPVIHLRATLPRLDVPIEVDGVKLDYALLPRFYSCWREEYTSTNLYFEAAAYREGEIMLDRKPRHVAVVDFNNNGRFDDKFEIRETAQGRIYGDFGDVLLVNPDPKPRYSYFFIGFTTPDGRYPMSRLIHIDGHFYNVEVPPVGDKLTVTPSPAPVGHVTGPYKGWCALVYNDQGCLKISAEEKSKRIPLPEGDWKLLSYTIDRTQYQRVKEEEQSASWLGLLSDALARSRPAPRLTLISAGATVDSKPVKVRRGQTVMLPFGPPYKPVVKVASGTGRETIQLEMSLVGSGGEVCRNVRIDRMSPKDPEFTISTPEGEEVASGKFKWG